VINPLKSNPVITAATHATTIQQDIDAIKARIFKTESERDAWRAAGRVVIHPLEPGTAFTEGTHIMTIHQDIDAIRARISKAESERDAWRAAGREEKYLESYVTVEALLLQLNERSRQLSIELPPA
jgi:hypothetical protein